MAASLPIVATCVGDVSEVVGRDAGILVRPKDPVALAKAMEQLMSNDAQRRVFGEAGKTKIEMKYSAYAWAQKLYVMYKQVILSRAPDSTIVTRRSIDATEIPSGCGNQVSRNMRNRG